MADSLATALTTKLDGRIKWDPTVHSRPRLKFKLRWLDTVFKNSGVCHFDMFKLRIFRIYSADIGFFIYFDNSTFKLY
jgi:hypothetical protein